MKRLSSLLSPLPVAILIASLALPPQSAFALRTESPQQSSGLEELAAQLAAPFKSSGKSSGLEEAVQIEVWEWDELPSRISQAVKKAHAGIPSSNQMVLTGNGFDRENFTLYQDRSNIPGAPVGWQRFINQYMPISIVPVSPLETNSRAKYISRFSMQKSREALSTTPGLFELHQMLEDRQDLEETRDRTWLVDLHGRAVELLSRRLQNKMPSERIDTLLESSPDEQRKAALQLAIQMVRDQHETMKALDYQLTQTYFELVRRADSEGRVDVQEAQLLLKELLTKLDSLPRLQRGITATLERFPETGTLPLAIFEEAIKYAQHAVRSLTLQAMAEKAHAEDLELVYYDTNRLLWLEEFDELRLRLQEDSPSEPQVSAELASVIVGLTRSAIALEQEEDITRRFRANAKVSSSDLSLGFSLRSGGLLLKGKDGSLRFFPGGGDEVVNMGEATVRLSANVVRDVYREGDQIVWVLPSFTGAPDVDQIDDFFESAFRLRKHIPGKPELLLGVATEDGVLRVYRPRFPRQGGEEKYDSTWSRMKDALYGLAQIHNRTQESIAQLTVIPQVEKKKRRPFSVSLVDQDDAYLLRRAQWWSSLQRELPDRLARIFQAQLGMDSADATALAERIRARYRDNLAEMQKRPHIDQVILRVRGKGANADEVGEAMGAEYNTLGNLGAPILAMGFRLAGEVLGAAYLKIPWVFEEVTFVPLEKRKKKKQTDRDWMGETWTLWVEKEKRFSKNQKLGSPEDARPFAEEWISQQVALARSKGKEPELRWIDFSKALDLWKKEQRQREAERAREFLALEQDVNLLSAETVRSGDFLERAASWLDRFNRLAPQLATDQSASLRLRAQPLAEHLVRTAVTPETTLAITLDEAFGPLEFNPVQSRIFDRLAQVTTGSVREQYLQKRNIAEGWERRQAATQRQEQARLPQPDVRGQEREDRRDRIRRAQGLDEPDQETAGSAPDPTQTGETIGYQAAAEIASLLERSGKQISERLPLLEQFPKEKELLQEQQQLLRNLWFVYQFPRLALVPEVSGEEIEDAFATALAYRSDLDLSLGVSKANLDHFEKKAAEQLVQKSSSEADQAVQEAIQEKELNAAGQRLVQLDTRLHRRAELLTERGYSTQAEEILRMAAERVALSLEVISKLNEMKQLAERMNVRSGPAVQKALEDNQQLQRAETLGWKMRLATERERVIRKFTALITSDFETRLSGSSFSVEEASASLRTIAGFLSFVPRGDGLRRSAAGVNDARTSLLDFSRRIRSSVLGNISDETRPSVASFLLGTDAYQPFLKQDLLVQTALNGMAQGVLPDDRSRRQMERAVLRKIAHPLPTATESEFYRAVQAVFEIQDPQRRSSSPSIVAENTAGLEESSRPAIPLTAHDLVSSRRELFRGDELHLVLALQRGDTVGDLRIRYVGREPGPHPAARFEVSLPDWMQAIDGNRLQDSQLSGTSWKENLRLQLEAKGRTTPLPIVLGLSRKGEPHPNNRGKLGFATAAGILHWVSTAQEGTVGLSKTLFHLPAFNLYDLPDQAQTASIHFSKWLNETDLRSAVLYRAAGLEEDEALSPVEMFEEMSDAFRPYDNVIVSLEGFPPAMLKENGLAPATRLAAPAAILRDLQPLLEPLRPGTRLSLAHEGGGYFTLSLRYLPLFRDYPGNRSPGFLFSRLRYLTGAVLNDRKPFSAAFQETFGPGSESRFRYRGAFGGAVIEVTEAQIRNLLGIAPAGEPTPAQKNMMALSPALMGVLTQWVHDADESKDGRTDSPQPLTAEGAVAALARYPDLQWDSVGHTVPLNYLGIADWPFLDRIHRFMGEAVSLTGLDQAGLEEKPAEQSYREGTERVRAAMQRLGVRTALTPGEVWMLGQLADPAGHLAVGGLDQRFEEWLPVIGHPDRRREWDVRYRVTIAARLSRELLVDQQNAPWRRERAPYLGRIGFVFGRNVITDPYFSQLRKGSIPIGMEDHLAPHQTLKDVHFLAQGDNSAVPRWKPAEAEMTVEEAAASGAVGYKTSVMLPVQLDSSGYSPYWERLTNQNLAWVQERAKEARSAMGGLGVGYLAGAILWAAPPGDFAPPAESLMAIGQSTERFQEEMAKEQPAEWALDVLMEAWLASDRKKEIEQGEPFASAHARLTQSVVETWNRTPGITLIQAAGPYFVSAREELEKRDVPARESIGRLAELPGLKGKMVPATRNRPPAVFHEEFTWMADAGLTGAVTVGRSLLQSLIDAKTGKFRMMHAHVFHQGIARAAVDLLVGIDRLREKQAPGVWSAHGIPGDQAKELIAAARTAGLEEPVTVPIDDFDRPGRGYQLSGPQLETVDVARRQRAKWATSMPLPHSLTVYVQGEHLLFLAEQYLHAPPQLQMAVEGIDDTIKEWDEMGFILENAGIDEPVPNPRELLTRRVWPADIPEINPVELLAQVVARRLGFPAGTMVGQMVYTDLHGRTYLVLFST